MSNWQVRNLIRKVVCPVLSRFEPPPFQEVSWGRDFPDRHFLVIRRHEPQAGLCSHFITTVGWIRWAVEHDMIPVVDLQNVRNMYLGWRELGKINAWESFFEQPCGFALSDIRHAKHVTIANRLPPVAPGGSVEMLSCRDGQLARWREIVRDYIKVNKLAIEPFRNKEFEAALLDGVVGVLARGTDYVRLRPHHHPVQPSAEQLVEKVRERFIGRPVYLVTEDASIVEVFRSAFGRRLIMSCQKCVDYSNGYLSDCKGVKHDRLRGQAYLKAIVDLSRCQHIIAGRTSGTVAAAVLSRGFESSFYFDLGAYP